MKKSYNILIICLLTTFANYGQQISIDSIFKKLNFYKNNNTDSTFFYANKLQQHGNNCQKLEGISAEAYAFYKKKDYKNAETTTLKLLEFCEALIISAPQKLCYRDSKISALNRLFWIEKNRENYKKACEHLFEIEKSSKNYPEKNLKYYRHQLNLKFTRANIKNALKLERQAKNLLIEAVEDAHGSYFDQIQNENYFLQSKANIFNTLGNTYMIIAKKESNKQLLDSSLYYYKKAYHLTNHFVPKHTDSEIFYSFRKTEVLIAQEKYQEAINLINDYKNINNGYDYKHREYFQKTICFHKLQQSDSAIANAYKSLNHKSTITANSKLISLYDILSKEYYKLKKYDSAFKYSQNTIKHFNLAEDNKEQSNQLLYQNTIEKAKELNATIKKEASTDKNYLSSIFGFTLVFIASLYFLFYRKKKDIDDTDTAIELDKLIITETKSEVTEELATDSNNKLDTKKEYNIDEKLEAKILAEIDRIDESLAFLKGSFSINDINVDTNSTYISFVFNKNKNQTFKQYYTSKKINYLVEKLKTDKKYRNYSIQALAVEIGYSNASAFTRAFKKQMDITPSAFIKSLEEL